MVHSMDVGCELGWDGGLDVCVGMGYMWGVSVDVMGWHCEWWMVNAMVDEIVFEHDIMCVDGMVDGMHVECKCG